MDTSVRSRSLARLLTTSHRVARTYVPLVAGREVARLFHAFGSTVYALTRDGVPTPEKGYTLPGTGDPSGSLPTKYYATSPYSSILDFFSACDVIVNVLPDTPRTHRTISTDEFKAMKGNAIYVNIGRGTTTDQDVLVEALRAKKEEGEADDATGTLRIGAASLECVQLTYVQSFSFALILFAQRDRPRTAPLLAPALHAPERDSDAARLRPLERLLAARAERPQAERGEARAGRGGGERLERRKGRGEGAVAFEELAIGSRRPIRARIALRPLASARPNALETQLRRLQSEVEKEDAGRRFRRNGNGGRGRRARDGLESKSTALTGTAVYHLQPSVLETGKNTAGRRAVWRCESDLNASDIASPCRARALNNPLRRVG